MTETLRWITSLLLTPALTRRRSSADPSFCAWEWFVTGRTLCLENESSSSWTRPDFELAHALCLRTCS